MTKRKPEPPEQVAARVARYRAARAADGLVRVEVMVPAAEASAIRALADKLRRGVPADAGIEQPASR